MLCCRVVLVWPVVRSDHPPKVLLRILVRRPGIFPAVLTRKAVLPDDHYHESYGEELMDYLEVIEADYRRADP